MTIYVVNSMADSSKIKQLRQNDVIVCRWGEPLTVLAVTDSEVKLRCPKHGVYTRALSSIGRKCESCDRQATTGNFVAKARAVHGDTYIYSSTNFVSSTKKVKIECRSHGTFEQEPRLHLIGKGCPKCGKNRAAESMRLTEEERRSTDAEHEAKRAARRKAVRANAWAELVAKFRAIYGDRYEYRRFKASRLITKFRRVKVLCAEHGVEETVDSRLLLQQRALPCSHCEARAVLDERATRTAERAKRAEIKRAARRLASAQNLEAKRLAKSEALAKKARKMHKKIDLSSFVFTTLKAKSVASCPQHGEFEASPEHLFKYPKNPCTFCIAEAKSQKLSPMNTKDTEHFIRLSREKYKDRYTYEKAVYVGKAAKITVTCKKHGPFSVVADYHMHKKTNYGGCPVCRDVHSPTGSCLVEAKVKRFIEKLGFQVVSRDRSTLKPYEIDLLVPSKLFGVEVNGEYWHSTKFKSKDYHAMKANMARDAGVKLYQFWYGEMVGKTPIVKSMLRSALGKTRSVYARKTEVKPVGTAERRAFFNECHLQGDARATVAYGLYLDGVLLACMSFGSPRFSNKYEWEIIRFSNALSTSVVGGAGKIWAHFVRQHNPSSVLSYADKRYSTGNLYLNLGFKHIGDTPPNYFWQNKRGVILTRYQTQKHKLKALMGDKFDPRQSEAENMKRMSQHRVYDAGHVRLVWHASCG